MDMRVLVCGGRNFANPIPYNHSEENKPAMDEYRFVHRYLDKFVTENSKEYKEDDSWLPLDIVIIEGGARGVDRAAFDWAIVNFAQIKEYPADWKKHGKVAGPIRNKQMIDEGKPDVVIAFPGGRGTANMVEQARKAGIKVIEVEYSG